MNHATDTAAYYAATAARPRTLAQISSIRATLERHLGLGVALAFAATALNNANAAPKPPTTAHDRAICASALVLESGGERQAVRGMRAVWEVVINRAANREMIPAAVVTQRKQFSCFNGITHAVAIRRARLHPRWNDALAIVSALPTGNLTGGSDHYHATTMTRPPYWADKAKVTATIGGHRFYRLNGQR